MFGMNLVYMNINQMLYVFLSRIVDLIDGIYT